MMAILNRNQDLPRERADLYEQCARLLLHQWKVEEALRADPDLAADALAIGFKEKQTLLRRLACEMQTGTDGSLGNLIAAERLEAVVEETLRGLTQSPHKAARALIRHLRERNFILCFAGGDCYAFVHRTFLEYFCADDLRQRFEHEKSIDLEHLKTEIYGRHWQDESWHEVLCLLAGMIHPGKLAPLLEHVLGQRDVGQNCEHVFLAARCVGEVRQRAALGVLEQEVRARLGALIRFDLGYFYQPWDEEAQKVKTVRERCVAAVAQIWRDGQSLAWLKARAQSDEHWAVRRAAVQELARGWKDDREVRGFLRELQDRNAASD